MTTVKTKYNDDLRRFTLQSNATVADLSAEIVKHYKFTEPFIVKYFDDEGDLISITTNEELHEAIRFSNTQKPPVLRITILGPSTSAPPVVQPSPAAVSVSTPKPSLPKEEEESKENPPLPISEWEPAKKEVPKEVKTEEAPKKIEVALNIPEKKAYVAPVTKSSIAQDTTDYCVATSQSVSDSSASAAANTLQSSNQILELVSQGDSGENASICASLSRQIAEDCAQLSKTTAVLCETLSKAMTQQSVSTGALPQELNQLSNNTVSICQRLSHETAMMCTELSQATSVLNQQAEKQLKSSELLKKQSEDLAKLAQATQEDCEALSAQTTASSLSESSNISAMVKGL